MSNANFNTDIKPIKKKEPFRYFVQKVLPLVYDDSLSYYELLSKMTDYINNCLENVDTLNDNVNSLNQAYEQLQSYVNNYFSNLDVQEEINNKLDQMAESGQLDGLFEKYMPYVTPEMYGAKGDGTTDDYTALNQCFSQNLPVIMRSGKTYKTTRTLNLNAPILKNGKIISSSNLNYIINVTSKSCVIENVEVDCQNSCAIGICADLTNGETIQINHCTIHNTDNASITQPVSCSGLYVSGYNIINITNNNIHDINRTKINPGNVSSTGINVKGNSILIENNTITNIKCSNETTDCDGISISQSNTFKTNSIVKNNIIIDSTGRGIKNQGKNCICSNNIISLINSQANLFYKCVDYQYGGGSINNNEFNLSNKCSSSSRVLHIDANENTNRTITFNNNIIDTDNTISSIVYFGTAAYDGELIIENNIIPKLLNYVVTLPSVRNNILIGIYNNSLNIYRYINTTTSVNYSNAKFIIQNNINNYVNSNIFSNSCTVKNVVNENNERNLLLNNVTLNIDSTSLLSTEYSGSALSSLPSPITNATHIFLKMLKYNLLQYYNYSNASSGIIELT